MFSSWKCIDKSDCHQGFVCGQKHQESISTECWMGWWWLYSPFGWFIQDTDGIILTHSREGILYCSTFGAMEYSGITMFEQQSQKIPIHRRASSGDMGGWNVWPLCSLHLCRTTGLPLSSTLPSFFCGMSIPSRLKSQTYVEANEVAALVNLCIYSVYSNINIYVTWLCLKMRHTLTMSMFFSWDQWDQWLLLRHQLRWTTFWTWICGPALGWWGSGFQRWWWSPCFPCFFPKLGTRLPGPRWFWGIFVWFSWSFLYRLVKNHPSWSQLTTVGDWCA